MSKFYFIVNPVAGSGRAKAWFEQAAAEMTRRGVDFSFDYTEGIGHGAQLAKAAAERGEQAVVSVGGDGTAREIAGSLLNTGIPMGVFPFGTGNDFGSALGLKVDPEGALEDLLKARPTAIDAAAANDTIFINAAGTGFDVDVIRNTEKYKRRFNGMLPYMLGIFKSLMDLKWDHFTITADGETFEEDAILIDACNGTRLAGGIKVAPIAELNDGMLDVCIVRKLGRLGVLRVLPSVVVGKHLNSPHVRYFKARELRLESTRANTLNLDGELGSSTPVTFKILPGALTLLLPPKEENNA